MHKSCAGCQWQVICWDVFLGGREHGGVQGSVQPVLVVMQVARIERNKDPPVQHALSLSRCIYISEPYARTHSLALL